MKKIILLAALLFTFNNQAKPCADYDPDYDYYNLFMQELVSDPQYYPFLMSYHLGYYSVPENVIKNDNIEQWQKYLGISYEQALHLVFKASRDDVRSLINGKSVSDANLKFITPAFVSKHKQSLLYLAYAKYLEPYMTITHIPSDEWSYYYPSDKTVDKLDYNQVINVLTKSWNAETDKELKLRYGYQLVRFAHYNRNYGDAVKYFDTYVEPLNYKPAIYYYALDQKSGALKGLNKVVEANYGFFQVFVHSPELKTGAYSSLTINNEIDFQGLMRMLKTDKERNDLYLMLGYSEFNNPLPSIEKIVSKTPDAIQAKVLMARTINSIERTILHTNQSCEECSNADKRMPISSKSENKFSDDALKISVSVANNLATKDKNFWNMTTAYLYFLNKDFSNAKKYLALVNPTTKMYASQKKQFELYIYISEQPSITAEVEETLFTKYKQEFNSLKEENYYYNSFIVDLLANRYFIQKDYAKSFLLNNSISALEYNPRLDLLNDIEAFVNKKNKNAFENYIANNVNPYGERDNKSFNIMDYIYNMKGDIYLSDGNLDQALKAYDRVSPHFKMWAKTGADYNGFSKIPTSIFGYNEIECFECSDNMTMGVQYLSDFPSIGTAGTMNKPQIVKALLSLKKTASGKSEIAAKANYVLGNFYYNITNTGYYRNIFRFDRTNGNGEKYRSGSEKDIYNGIYFKDYYWNTYFKNDINTPEAYLEKAYEFAKDNELRAQIAFALSKCEQAEYYENNNMQSYYWINSDQIFIKGRKYFEELAKYESTDFYSKVLANCNYFEYYVNHYK